MNRPQTQDGWQVWDLVGRLGGQLRVIPGAVLGWDMGAALALAQALGINPLIAAELLPEIEAVMVRKLNEQMLHQSEIRSGAGFRDQSHREGRRNARRMSKVAPRRRAVAKMMASAVASLWRGRRLRASAIRCRAGRSDNLREGDHLSALSRRPHA
ncbi:DUF7697 family protein [Pseudorhodobacter aquimaris]|uniref:DUF7697 family protein n=1 Tax=Pseudorhodobacter aquimaris TaxID=687412 RepID=UPI00067B0635|nr:hypothetical protein [Pseudorhodobacter aquimaris]